MESKLIEQFEELLRSTGREGIEDLIKFYRKSDFYHAPASTKFHSCHDGGLLEHSMNVYQCLCEMKDMPVWKEAFEGIGDDTLIISALCHDTCKANMYKPEWRNKKVYCEDGSKYDAGGNFDWVSVQSYSIDDQMPLGHGEKSVMIVGTYISLKPVERYAIRWHMGFTEPKENWNYFTKSIQRYPFVLAVHMADLQATYLLEEEV